MVCAILHKKHYDLGVVHTVRGIQAVFQVGEEWDNAIRLFSNLLRQSCRPLGRLSVSSARWKERKQESEVKACVDLSGVRTRSARAQAVARTFTRGKTKHTTRRDTHTHTKQHNPHM